MIGVQEDLVARALAVHQVPIVPSGHHQVEVAAILGRDQTCISRDLEREYEADEVIVQQLMRANVEGSLKVHACHLREMFKTQTACDLG